MRVIPFYGLRRSGIHAVLEWLTHSLGDGGQRVELQENRIIRYNNAAYLNDCSTWESDKIEGYLQDCDLNFVLVSYEDTSLDFSYYATSEKPIVVIRDIKNLAASRIRSWKTFNEEVLNNWIEHAQSESKQMSRIIRYESWLTDKGYRNGFVSCYNKQNLDKTDYVSKFGSGSSFIGRKLDKVDKLLNRWKQIGFSDNVKSLLEKEEVSEARKLMGYL